MARLKRLHIPGGIHYIILHSNEEREIFPDPADYESFARLVERCARRCHVHIFAYCWSPHEVHFAIQVSSVPLGRFVQRLAGQHARLINRRLSRTGHLFQQRYWTVRIEKPADLPEVVRHIHMTPVRLGLAQDPSEYRWTSHATYLGTEKNVWVTSGPVLRSLDAQGPNRRDAYRKFMEEGLTRRSGMRAEDTEFLSRLMPRRRRPPDPAMLNTIIDSVATKLAVPRDAMLSPSRRRNLSLARALVAWHATHNEVATLTEVARRFQRNPSTLCVGVERYRRVRRDLFEEPIDELLEMRTERRLSTEPAHTQANAAVG